MYVDSEPRVLLIYSNKKNKEIEFLKCDKLIRSYLTSFQINYNAGYWSVELVWISLIGLH